MIYRVRLLLISVLVIVVCGCSKPAVDESGVPAQSAAVPAAASPNVLLIVVDTLRADRIDAARNGVPVMPKISAWAKESWNYQYCVTPSTWTKPSMVSMFTSLYPEVHRVLFGVHDTIVADQPAESDAIPDSLMTLATYLKSSGYQTAAIQTNPNLGENFGFHQGFDTYFFSPYPAFTGDKVTKKALVTLDELKPPFFFYVHYMDPHAPYNPPEPHRTAFGPEPALPESDQNLLGQNYPNFYNDLVSFQVGLAAHRNFPDLSAEGKVFIQTMYDGGVHFADDETSALIAAVRAKYPDTIIVFTADHGEELWEHGSVGHGKTVFEDVAHVPLIVNVPGEAPRSIDAPVELVDIVPTLASLLELAPHNLWQGKNIAVAADALPMDRPAFSMTKTSLATSKVDLQSVSQNGLKLVRDNKNAANLIFDLKADPTEQAPLQSAHEQAVQLMLLLEQHDDTNRKHPGLVTAPQRVEISPETEKDMSTIGYMQNKEQEP